MNFDCLTHTTHTCHRPFNFFLVSIRDYGGKKSSEIGVDGHDVPLIPRPSNAPPHPSTTSGRGAGKAGGLGGWGTTTVIALHMHLLLRYFPESKLSQLN